MEYEDIPSHPATSIHSVDPQAPPSVFSKGYLTDGKIWGMGCKFQIPTDSICFMIVGAMNSQSLPPLHLYDELVAALTTAVLSYQHVDVLLCLPRQEQTTDFRPTLRQLQFLQ